MSIPPSYQMGFFYIYGWFGLREGMPKTTSSCTTGRPISALRFAPEIWSGRTGPARTSAPTSGDSELPHRRRTAEARRQPLGVDRARREVRRRMPHGAMAGGAVLRTRGTMVAQDSHGAWDFQGGSFRCSVGVHARVQCQLKDHPRPKPSFRPLRKG